MSKDDYISDEDFLEKPSNKINGILSERCLHLVQKYPQLTFVVVLLIASNSITQQIKCNKLNNETKNLKIQDKLLDKELKELRLAVAKLEDRKADLKEGLQRQDEVGDKGVKDLQHALALQNDVWQNQLKEFQQALSLQDDIRQRESRKNIEAREQISNQMRIMYHYIHSGVCNGSISKNFVHKYHMWMMGFQ